MRLLLVSITLTLFATQLLAQSRVRTEGSAQVEWFDYESRQEVQSRAKDLATVDALERAFGRIVVQGNATYINNVQSGTNVETNSVFNMIANTSVKGEVLKEISCNFEELKGSRIIEDRKVEITDIRCDIVVQAREITTPPVTFVSNTYNCLNDGCRTEFFKNKDGLYLKFNTPVSGYLSIFLDDGSVTSRLLPYRNVPIEYESSVPVISDTDYFFFSPDRNELPIGRECVDEYYLEIQALQELNRIFVVFCTEPVRKPRLSKTEEEILPYNLESEDFQRWLHKYRAYYKEKMQVGIIDIQVTK